jgi:hypothetical protein
MATVNKNRTYGKIADFGMLQGKKLISCLPMIGGSLRVLLPPLKLVAMI